MLYHSTLDFSANRIDCAKCVPFNIWYVYCAAVVGFDSDNPTHLRTLKDSWDVSPATEGLLEAPPEATS